MSGQYPGGYNNNPVGGHRGNFGNQMGNMNPMQNQMGMMSGYNQAGMMPQQGQQPTVQMQTPAMSGIGTNVLNPVGIQSPSHVQQGANPLAQQQQQPQQQQQQQNAPQLTLQTPSTPTPGSAMMAPQPQALMQPQAPPTGMLTSTAPSLPQKEINIVGLSRLGQETVQDITSRFQEIFSALKTIQPTGNRDSGTEKKVQEYFRTIRLLFKRVRIIYEKCNDGYPQGMEYTHVESLIPYKDESDHRAESTQCEEYRKAMAENRELIDTVMLKNKQLREIIDRSRIIIWEINTMLSMRRS